MSTQQYCLRWNNHQPNFISVFSSLLNSESLVDVTLAAEGKHLQAHKVVLSACSSYFQTLFTINPCQHPIVILKDVKFTDLKVMVDFMYYGEVNVSQEQLPHILKTAEMLKIKGLAELPVDHSMAKTHNTSADRVELLTPGDSNWSADGIQRRSLSPSPCPLSPASRRKRLRKSSTGSGSGSAERTSEEHASSEMTLTSSVSSTLGTVIKSDPGFVSECSTPLRNKQHSSDSELHRGSSHESIEAETAHHITLQVPQQDMSHSLEASSGDIAGPSTSQTVTGIQWGIMEHVTYPHYNPSQQTLTLQNNMSTVDSQCVLVNAMNFSPPTNNGQMTTSPQQIVQKRKRSVNPQADENFVKALEAVRFGGIGFCKAARMYGVNNRTLWLEYKKRGYPNFRMSIKNRVAKQEFNNTNAEVNEVQQEQQQQQQQQQASNLVTAVKSQEVTERLSVTTHAQVSQCSQQTMGTKRGRFLMRQPRIKRESDPTQNPEADPLSPQFLSVPPVRVERQCSEPLPSHSPPLGNLLSVPGMLVKQHSHPLLPSQTQTQSSPPVPLHIQLLPHTQSGDTERAVSPVVVVSDPLSTTPPETPLRMESGASATATLRVKTDELKRSVSSPQAGTRSSHCPAVRPGPALGCNYCWNTVDTHGRILRRKTKYHCPECHTNLCIVPCFQEYHERHVTTGQADPITLTTSVMRIFPKTTSM